MVIINFISFILFLVFVISYFLKLYILSGRNQIKANVLGKKGKSAGVTIVEMIVKLSSFGWAAVWCFHSLFGNTLFKTMFQSSAVSLIGIIATGAGVAIFIIAMVQMRTSWRVGIDDTSRTTLITSGVYRYSRNPAFVGFDLMFIGLYLMYPNWVTLCVAVLNLVAFHCLILQEEKHLRSTFGESYHLFSQKTPRYLWFRL
ncbi:Protein-S-isoprenylcysteine O-methyltransferase Ste14 [Fontibacillus panacisegetis]|uniref:Protein-S-isoprenylcysteine O-methyltransferase Ste14 n=1 Tax=Fontibacillus panacisegetis TaxID=670482 RepID=A0A1G7R7Y4_9BACL|nr:isoprenylcysteine carboxylmethyltransferase family protein [Fontibacillus panacisegetis]SDG06765.1 Protein-S-isoprenylcysteine O-methyltransferase Ste14 [Fontibacillus panacisegetis]